MDVLVVGAGPAGLAAAARLAAAGAGAVEVLERERTPGGVPRLCDHTGFGLRELRRPVSGPVYALRRADAAEDAGAAVRTGVSATGWAGPLTLDTTSPAGLERITARAVVLATGARERPRAARLVPGTRPEGVLTGGELLRAVRLYGERVGTRAVVVGAEPAAHHTARTLLRAGVDVAALVSEEPWHRPGAFGPAHTPASAPVPVLGGTSVTELLGRGRLSGVRLRRADGRTTTVACDTVVFTGGWIPEHELARYGGVVIDPGTRGPAVDTAFHTSGTGVFAVGDVLRGVESADRASAEGRSAADAVLRYLAGGPWPHDPVPVTVEAPLRWVAPNRVALPLGADDTAPLLVRAGERLTRPSLEVRQDGRLLYRHRSWRTAHPARSVRLPGPAAWPARVDPDGGPVRIAVA
ncbi:NAD(P)/FAD-dependent oxidoreductase [Streptomyces coeruleoprunus]|uniref:NAD(P)/FAD-dependent oxidoreductase n=1 Tax=Streptomyces coeruleoprunus TaxID=285563 RepID=A0ABV9X852_9ACTN